MIGDCNFENREIVTLVDFSKARQYISDEGEIIKDDGVIYRVNADLVAFLYDRMSDLKSLSSFLNGLCND